MTSTVWTTRLRPVLTVLAESSGIVDLVACADELGLAVPEVVETLHHLAKAGLVEARPGELGWRLDRVCPLTTRC